jgi:hypothetical protein
MPGKSAARHYRLEAQQFREMAKEVHSESIRHDLLALASQYEDLADYVEAPAKCSGSEAAQTGEKRAI